MSDQIDELLWDAADLAVADRKRAFLARIATLTERCESPIERVLYAYLAAGLLNQDAHWSETDVVWPNTHRPEMKRGEFCIYTQARIKTYRADIMIEYCANDDNLRAWIAVECDGHEFHERTKEQAARDRKRDRDMQALGIIVMRFTGSEIWRDATKCVLEIANMVASIRAKG